MGDPQTTLAQKLARGFSNATIHRLYHITSHFHIHPLSGPTLGHIREALNTAIIKKWNGQDPAQDTPVHRVLPLYVNRHIWDIFNIRKIFSSVNLRQLLPDAFAALPLWRPQFRHKTTRALRRIFINNRDMAFGKWAHFPRGNLEALQDLTNSVRQTYKHDQKGQEHRRGKRSMRLGCFPNRYNVLSVRLCYPPSTLLELCLLGHLPRVL
jgi:hypothetical protein